MKRVLWLVGALALGIGISAPAKAQVIGGYYGGGYGPFYNYSWTVDPRPPFQRYGYRAVPQGNYPIAGLNSPALGTSDARRATFAGDAAKGSFQDSTARKLEDVIRNEGLVSATVIKAGTAGVTVRPDAGDRTPIRYSAADVYFLVAGELTTAKKLQNYLQPGDRVLIPQP